MIAIGLTIAITAGGCVTGDDDSEQGPDPSPDPGAPDASNDPDPDPDPDLGNGLSTQCNAVCARTPVASQLQGQCTAVTLADIGGYAFTQPSCIALEDAFSAGVATVDQCVTCYLDANVAGTHCAQTEATCFFGL